jgi:hypothetical protein
MMQDMLKRMKAAKTNKQFFELKQELDWLQMQMRKN